MFEHARCPDFAFVTAAPFVNMPALSTLADLRDLIAEGQASIIECEIVEI
jgi:hypothetical protein